MSVNKITHHSDMSEHHVAQTHVWGGENKGIGEDSVRNLSRTNNPKMEKINVEGNKNFSYFMEHSDDLEGALTNISDKKFEFELGSQYISVKGKLKQQIDYWKNTIKAMTPF